MQRWPLVTLIFSCFLLIFSSAPRAFAGEPKRIVVGEITGKAGAQVRAALVKALAGHSNLKLVARAHVEKVAAQLGVEMDEPKGVKKLGEVIGLAAIVEGEVKSKGGTWTATVRVRGTSDGEVSESHPFKGKSIEDLAGTVSSNAWQQLSPAISEAPPPPSKKGKKKRVVVLVFSGPKAATVRDWTIKALAKEKSIQIVSAKEAKQASLTSESKGPAVSAAGAALDASLFVGGTTRVKAGSTTLDVNAINGADGESLGQFTLKAPNLVGLKRSIDTELGRNLAAPMKQSSTPEPPEETAQAAAAPSEKTEAEAEPETETKAAEKKPPAEPASEEEGAASVRHSALEVGLGIRAFSRNFRYTDDYFDALRSYKLGVAPAAFGWLRWYPAAHFSSGPAAHVGLVAGYERGFALKSRLKTGEEYATHMREWYVGLRGRIPFDPHEVGIQLSYGVHSFVVDDDPKLVPPVPPDVEYKFIRLGVDGRIRVQRAIIGAHIGYRFVSDSGEIESDKWFPRLSVGGVDAGVLAGYEILPGLDILAGFDFRRYFYSMNPQPGDPNIAGGALDEYIAGWGGLGYRLPGGR